MCGILFTLRLVASTLDVDDPAFNALLTAVTPRGPDSLKIHVSHVTLATGQVVEIKLAASVLGLRGYGVTSQPLEDEHGVLAWNGQVFQGMDIGVEENDTAKLFQRLKHEALDDVLASVEGPYACVYFDVCSIGLFRPLQELINQKVTKTVHYRIDPLSRRSLLIHQPSDSSPSDCFVLCSARCSSSDVDLPMRAMNGGEGGVVHLDRVAVQDGRLDLSEALIPSAGLEADTPWTHVSPINTALPPTSPSSPGSEVSTFIANLTESVRRRVVNIPPLPGSARLAILFSGGVDCTLLAALAHRCLPLNEPIDLINVAFQRSPPAPPYKSKTPTTPNPPPTEIDYAVPDRLSGLEAAQELRAACPGRAWQFVEVNVGYEECMAHRARVVDLMYPSETEMDLSLALPLYFASRGVGTVQRSTDGPKEPYTVKAKVYLSGLGADEQLAGYSRHLRSFQSNHLPGLISELQLDITRLPTRNLSRDDRILSSHARDARFPYLDLGFISYLSSLPVWLKCDLSRLGGDKLLLRLAAREVGLHITSGRVKRAMQFGTRSAKVGGAGRGAKKGGLAIQSM